MMKPSGCKKVESKKMTNKTNQPVTFSKMRYGVMKRASELVTLYGAEVALLGFSPSGEAFSFGEPSIEVLLDRCVRGIPNDVPYNNTPNPVVQSLNLKLEQLLEAKKAEKEKMNKFKMARIEMMKKPHKEWCGIPLEELNLTQVLEMQKSLQDLKKQVSARSQPTPEV